MKKSYSGLALHTKKTVFRKAVALCVFLFFCSISVSAKESTFDNNASTELTSALIVVSDSTSVYNSAAINNAKIVLQNTTHEDTINQKAEIFVSADALIYNAEAFSNAEIVQLESSQEHNFQDIQTLEIQKSEAVAKTVKHKQTTDSVFINAVKNHSEISQSTKENAVFVQVNSPTSFKTVKNTTVAFRAIVLEAQKVIITYQNPFFTTSRFSGKHSVRPPTFFV